MNDREAIGSKFISGFTRVSLICLIHCSGAWAETIPAATAAGVPPAQVLEAEGAIIGEITIDTENVFDPSIPEEDRKLYRLANNLHVRTRPKIIRRQLLFKEGDIFQQRLLDESERILRSNSYLRDASIVPVRIHDGKVDILVRTDDVWTLDPRLSIGRSGGANNYTVGVKDANFLGTGIYVGLFQKSTVDRDSSELVFRDRELGNTRYYGSGRFQDNSDGRLLELNFGHPFYELDGHRANAISLLNDKRVDSLYDLGEVQDKFYHDIQYYEVSAGKSRGLRNGWVNRYTVGLTYDDQTFAPYTDESLPYMLVPEDRKFVYPFVQWELLEDDFEETRNHDQIGQTEDRYLGTSLLARIGYASESFGSNANAALMDFKFHTGFGSSETDSLIADILFHSRLESGEFDDAFFDFDAIYHHRHSTRQLFHAELSGALGYNLDLDHQILLGGDSGLRGYPLRYQGGDAKVLLTLEERLFTDWYPFHLIRIGGAVFFDVGRTWGQNPVGGESLGWLSDVGFGFRFGNTRSGIGRLVHLDFAFPLDRTGDIDSFQILLKGKASF